MARRLAGRSITQSHARKHAEFAEQFQQLDKEGGQTNKEQRRFDHIDRMAGEIAANQRMIERPAEDKRIESSGRPKSQDQGPCQAGKHRAKRILSFAGFTLRHGSILFRVRWCAASISLSDERPPAYFYLPVKSSCLPQLNEGFWIKTPYGSLASAAAANRTILPASKNMPAAARR